MPRLDGFSLITKGLHYPLLITLIGLSKYLLTYLIGGQCFLSASAGKGGVSLKCDPFQLNDGCVLMVVVGLRLWGKRLR